MTLPVAIPVAVMAGITLQAALYHSLLHLRMRDRLRRDSHIAALALLIGVYDVCCIGLYTSGSVGEGAFWQRLQLATLTTAGLGLVHFVESYAEERGPIWLRRIAFGLPILGVIGLFERRGWLLRDEPAIKAVDVPIFGHVVYHEQRTGPLFALVFASMLYVLGYSFAIARKARRNGKTQRANALLLSVFLFVVGMVNDGLLASGHLHSIYVVEYTFTSILVLVGYTLSSEVVEATRAKQALAERELRLAHAQRLESMGRLAGGVAHDLNNMLTPVMSYVELAQRRMERGSAEHRFLASALAAATRAAALTQQLLALGRKQVLEVRPIDLGAGIRELEPLMRHLLPAGATLVVEVQPGLPLVEADAGQLDQVWMNLTANARDAMPEGGRLLFTAEREGTQGVLVTVSDTGVGMAPDTMHRIFEPFFTTKTRGEGTGLGLSIVQGIVVQHGGRIEAESALGRGTTFRLRFPATARRSEESAELAPRAGRPREDVRLLVVDDDDAVRNLAVEVLAQQGYEVHAAASEAELRGLLGTLGARLDLLLSDVILADTDGPTVRALVTSFHPDVPCLFMTGHADELLAPRGMLREDVELLRKPFTADRLVDKVRAVLARSPVRSADGGPQPTIDSR